MLDRPECILGYRHVWHSLQLKRHRVPRQVVESLLREMDPVGCEQRKEQRLKSYQYHNPGSKAVRHADGYDKLKPYRFPYGFPVHGCTDGWSRPLLWLVITHHNGKVNIDVEKRGKVSFAVADVGHRRLHYWQTLLFPEIKLTLWLPEWNHGLTLPNFWFCGQKP